MQELRDLLLSEGIFALTIADIAARLKCSRRRIYEIAPTKEELFLKIADETLGAVREVGWREASGRSDPAEKIQAYFDYGAKVAAKMSLTFLRDLDQLEAGKRMFDEHQRERIRGLERLITEGIRSGGFSAHRPKFVAEVSFLVVRQLRDPAFQRAAGVTLEKGLREFWDLVLFGLVGRAGEPERAQGGLKMSQPRGPVQAHRSTSST